MSPRVFAGILPLICLCASIGFAAGDRETKVRNDRKEVEADDYWIYNDLDRGLAEAKQTGKPLLVVFRCIPCEACSKFDEQVVRRDPVVRDLMDQFVPVRIVKANTLDLTLFQYDYDQSFAAFLMNADKTIYGRFGTRSGRDNEDQDMSMEGFAKALAAALDLHEDYPRNKAQLAGKRGPAPLVETPLDYPSLKGKYDEALNYEGNVVKSCLHCHQVREAERLAWRESGNPVPDNVMYPYPMPAVLGLVMDPKEAATVRAVEPESTAAGDGFRPGDEIVSLAGQPMISIADMQWVLHNAGDPDTLPAVVRRNGRTRLLTLSLDEGWRARSDISWRATSWDLRRIATGGLVLEEMSADERRAAEVPEDGMALRVKHVGQYGEHAAAKRAGFQKGDVIIRYDGRSDLITESALLAEMFRTKRHGQKVSVTVRRGPSERQLTLPIQ